MILIIIIKKEIRKVTKRVAALSLFLVLVSIQTKAEDFPKDFQCTGDPHTVHEIAVNKAATCVLSKLYEPQIFCLTDKTGKDIDGAPFSVTPGQSVMFAMIFGDGADFNMEYALTCVESGGSFSKSPKVIFTIGANGPADPNVSIVNLYGAQGSFVTTGEGENYTISF
jgi:hypothetical protein